METSSQKRLLFALALSFVATLLYTQFVVRPQTEREAAARSDAGVELAQLDAGAPAQVALAPADAGVGLPPAPPVELPPLREVKLHTEQVRYAFSSEGAGLTQAELQGPKMREQQQVGLLDGIRRILGADLPPPPQMDMATPVPQLPLPLSISVEGSLPLPANTRYRVEESEQKVIFTASQGGWEVRKTLQWKRPGFEAQYQLELKNAGPTLARGELGLHLSRALDPSLEEKPSFLLGSLGNLTGAACYARVEKGPELFTLLPTAAEPKLEKKGALHFFGVDQQYFLAALYPLEGPKEGRCVLTVTPTARATDAYFPLTLGPGETATFRFGLFIGPKDDQLLAAVVGPQGFKPELDQAISLGWWAVIAKLIFPVMKFFYSLFGNWGVAIIFLTLVVKLLLLPLTHKAMVSAEQLKKLQPRMEEIRKKFAEDRERQNLELMKLYQEAKVNPLGGCLPLLPQLPIWGGLFAALRTSYDLYNEPFLAPLWTDLTYKDPAYLLPIALGVTMIITQKLQPMVMERSQYVMFTYVMPVFFTVIMLQYPAGLSLYIFTNNILSIAQQKLLRRYLEHKGKSAPPSEKKPGEPDRKKKKMKEREA